MVYYNPVIHLDVAAFGNGGIFQNLLTVNVNGSENERADVGAFFISGVDAQTGAARLGQEGFQDVAANQVTVGLLGVCIIVGLNHFSTEFGTDVFTDRGAKRTGNHHGFIYILCHGNQFVGNE